MSQESCQICFHIPITIEFETISEYNTFQIRLPWIFFINSFMTEAIITLKPVHWTGFYMRTASVMKELKVIKSKNLN